MNTLTAAQVLRCIAESLEAGFHQGYGLERRRRHSDDPWIAAGTCALYYVHMDADEFRLAPKNITYTVTHPEPLRVAPKDDTAVWALTRTGEVIGWKWYGVRYQCDALERGNLFATKEDAQAADAARLAAYRSAAEAQKNSQSRLSLEPG